MAGPASISAALAPGCGSFDNRRDLFNGDSARGEQSPWTVSRRVCGAWLFERTECYFKPMLDLRRSRHAPASHDLFAIVRKVADDRRCGRDRCRATAACRRRGRSGRRRAGAPPATSSSRTSCTLDRSNRRRVRTKGLAINGSEARSRQPIRAWKPRGIGLRLLDTVVVPAVHESASSNVCKEHDRQRFGQNQAIRVGGRY